MNWDTLKLIWTRLTEQLGLYELGPINIGTGRLKRRP